jgi:hypothetical protein
VENDFGLAHVAVRLQYQKIVDRNVGRGLAYGFAVDNNTVAAYLEIKTIRAMRMTGWAQLVYGEQYSVGVAIESQ